MASPGPCSIARLLTLLYFSLSPLILLAEEEKDDRAEKFGRISDSWIQLELISSILPANSQSLVTWVTVDRKGGWVILKHVGKSGEEKEARVPAIIDGETAATLLMKAVTHVRTATLEISVGEKIDAVGADSREAKRILEREIPDRENGPDRVSITVIIKSESEKVSFSNEFGTSESAQAFQDWIESLAK